MSLRRSLQRSGPVASFLRTLKTGWRCLSAASRACVPLACSKTKLSQRPIRVGEAVALARWSLGGPLGPVQRAAIACRRPPARWRSSGLLRYLTMVGPGDRHRRVRGGRESRDREAHSSQERREHRLHEATTLSQSMCRASGLIN